MNYHQIIKAAKGRTRDIRYVVRKGRQALAKQRVAALPRKRK